MMRNYIKNLINKNKEMVKVVFGSLGIIFLFQFGEFLMQSAVYWLEITGIGITFLAMISTLIYLYKTTPIMVRQIKSLFNK